MIQYIHRDDEIIVVLDGYTYSIQVDDNRYEEVLDLIEDGNEDELRELVSRSKRATKMFKELEAVGFTFEDGDYYYNEQLIPCDLNDYLGSAIDNGNYSPVVNFVRRLFENPQHSTRERLFGFMEANKHPILNDGAFMAFKVVRSDYYDKHTGTVINAPGITVPLLPWSKVDTNEDKLCSFGYHVCSKEYIGQFYRDGDRIVSVAVFPEFVGAIPPDYNNSKVRCRQYRVLADITDKYRDEYKLDLENKNDGLEVINDDYHSFRRDYF